MAKCYYGISAIYKTIWESAKGINACAYFLITAAKYFGYATIFGTIGKAWRDVPNRLINQYFTY